MLILDNIQVPVNKTRETYSSVISAWKNALVQMEGLISGVSQEAHQGDIILGLSAWHLFPDLEVVAPCPTSVRQRDTIFKHGGVLTIGLFTSNLDSGGIHWSLPLAHLRYYGAPVVSSRTVDGNVQSRISANELLLATFGCVLQGWGEIGSNTFQAASWFNHVFTLLEKSSLAGGRSARILLWEGLVTWFSLLLKAARQYVESHGNDRKTANKLILLGRKHGKLFLGRPAEPLFGLLGNNQAYDYEVDQSAFWGVESLRPKSNFGNDFSASSMVLAKFSLRGRYVSLIIADDDKIHFLRKVAQDIATEMKLGPTQIFIRYKRRYVKWSKHVYEYTTALPWSRSTSKRKLDRSEHEILGHRRWLYNGGDLTGLPYGSRNLQESSHPFHVDSPHSQSSSLGQSSSSHQSENDWTQNNTIYHVFNAEQTKIIRQEFENRKRFHSSLGEDTFEREGELIEEDNAMRLGISWNRMGCKDESPVLIPHRYKLLYGDEDSAGLFVIEGMGKMLGLVRPADKEAADFYGLFEAGKIDATAISNQLLQTLHGADAAVDPHFKALKAVSTAAAMYQNFSNTSVDVRILQQPLWKAAWVKDCHDPAVWSASEENYIPSSLQPYTLDRTRAFSCIAMFESGTYDIDPDLLENVIAMSSSDSIYIGKSLLHDPHDVSSPGEIRRVLGNIGKPGIAFLVPPVDPMIQEVNMADWARIDRDEFNGDMRDCFEKTSLHLSFTGANTPVNVGFSGEQDTDIYMLETLISVRDGGEWIADLDVFNTIHSAKLQRMELCQDQSHNSMTATKNLTAIDNWFGLIDSPEVPLSIVRAHKNWQARLAATSISVFLGYETLVLCDPPCWYCINSQAKAMSWGRFQKMIMIG
jgi:hypothetical protein